MQVVYEAAHSLDAHLIAGILRQANIPAHIAGEFLQGGAGELPAFGLIRVMVETAHAAAARALIEDWHNATPIQESPE